MGIKYLVLKAQWFCEAKPGHMYGISLNLMGRKHSEVWDFIISFLSRCRSAEISLGKNN